MLLPPIVLLLILLPLAARVDTSSAQVPARVKPPLTHIDAESRTYVEAGAEAPLRGNGPLTGYGYFFSPGRTSSIRTSTCAWSSRRSTSHRS